MSTFPNSPRLLKGSLELADPDASKAQKIIVLKCNADTLRRSLHGQGMEGKVS